MTRPAQPIGPATPYEVIVIVSGAGQAGPTLSLEPRQQGRPGLVGDAVIELARAGDHFEVRTAQRSYFADQVVVATDPSCSDYSWITVPGVVQDGGLLHGRGATPVPGIHLLEPLPPPRRRVPGQ